MALLLPYASAAMLTLAGVIALVAIASRHVSLQLRLSLT
jgi:hypothetical protein